MFFYEARCFIHPIQIYLYQIHYHCFTSLSREARPLPLDGLSTSLRITWELHDGVIWAESCPAGGSAFHVRLPVDEQEEEKSPTPLVGASVH
jgi:light-regulated signal transduction histidine kinase (bacteriophytochrome)